MNLLNNFLDLQQLDAGNYRLSQTAVCLQETIPQVIKPFLNLYRIPNGDRWKYDGTGLGLTLVKKLTEHLGGAIKVESETGHTCFTVKIPVNV